MPADAAAGRLAAVTEETAMSRRTLPVVVLASALALTGCAAGSTAVKPAQACANGAVFDCPTPSSTSAPAATHAAGAAPTSAP
jgi:hypothetical protein